MFKLAVATSFIVVLVILSQSSVALQIYRLNAKQNSILHQSVPLLGNTEEFARLTAKTLAQTTLLEESLSEEELLELQEKYHENETQAERIFTEIISTSLEPELTSAFETSLQRFVHTNEQLFDSQFELRQKEQELQQVGARLVSLATIFEDVVDQLLVRATTEILSKSLRIGSDETMTPTERDLFVVFAAEVEVLNSLKSDVVDISNLVQAEQSDFKTSESSGFAEKLRFRVRSISQSLALLQPTEMRANLAVIAAAIKTELSSPTGYIQLQKDTWDSRRTFEALKREQVSAVGEIDARVELIVRGATASFENDIKLASDLTRTIMWICILTSIFVLCATFIVNKRVIRNQISRRFTKLTEDILTISSGNYAHPIRVNGTDEIGDIAGALGVFKDQAAELERSNAELERFAYVAAHDLRSPLDAIQDLARWTLEDERESLSASCIENLELLIKRSTRLSVLQADLLTYAQVNQMDTSLATISFEEEVTKISDMLDPAGHFNIRLENDPGDIVTYSVPVRQVLINLITNAIKHHDKSTGQIVVRFERQNGRLKFTVEDDGPGIEPRFQIQVFELFKTLKSRDQVEGSGLGLALITKIADRLRGTVTVHSDAPKKRGTRFVLEIAETSKNPRIARAA